MMLTTGYVAATERYTEPGFFEFALLGPSMEASDYPYNVTATQPITLLVFVANRMPGPERVRIKMLMDSSNLQVGDLATVAEQDLELSSQENRTITYRFTLSQFGFTDIGSYRVVFELYRNAPDGSRPSSWPFTGLWLQTWLNVHE